MNKNISGQKFEESVPRVSGPPLVSLGANQTQSPYRLAEVFFVFFSCARLYTGNRALVGAVAPLSGSALLRCKGTTHQAHPPCGPSAGGSVCYR